jgi:hypothetical protein
VLESTPNLDLREGEVREVGLDGNGCVSSVTTYFGVTFACRSAVVTTGTFMNGTIWVGRQSVGAGRAGEPASQGLTECLVALGFEAGRLKTGTPARVDGRTVDYSVLEEQKGDEEERLVVSLVLRRHRRCGRGNEAQLLDAHRDRALPEVVWIADRIARPQRRDRFAQGPLEAGGVLADSGQSIAEGKTGEPDGAFCHERHCCGGSKTRSTQRERHDVMGGTGATNRPRSIPVRTSDVVGRGRSDRRRRDDVLSQSECRRCPLETDTQNRRFTDEKTMPLRRSAMQPLSREKPDLAPRGRPAHRCA